MMLPYYCHVVAMILACMLPPVLLPCFLYHVIAMCYCHVMVAMVAMTRQLHGNSVAIPWHQHGKNMQCY